MAVNDYSPPHAAGPYTGFNPYGDAMTAGQNRQQMMAARLMQGQQPAPQAPMGGNVMPLSGGGGGGAVGGGGGVAAGLAGLDPKAIAEGLRGLGKALGPEGKVGLFGGQDGYKSGFLGTGIGGYNSEGANVLQDFGMFNPLPTT